MAGISRKRLGKELREIESKGAPAGITLLTAEDLSEWMFSIEVLGESIYKGEVYVLRFKFSPTYPIDSPEVTFVVDADWKAPLHRHVYSNGHICASILGNEWSPVLSVISVCLTLQSMLASSQKKERPPDNDRYVKHAPLSPKKTLFHYDDDSV